jgi:hypothetical protein
MQESGKTFSALAYEGAIDYLAAKGMIDPDAVGISGFSRTVCFVGYTLTHPKHRFRAAVLADGIDCGYFQYLAYDGGPDSTDLNGASPPFGQGLKYWINEAPGFNLDKVHAPVRLVVIGSESVLGGWEWFSGLVLQNKPVDFILIPDGVHLLQKPWDRRIAIEGIVDWFRFWLKGEEDPEPAKANQYARWRELREQHEVDVLKGKTPN